jgi:hypothetical protein
MPSQQGEEHDRRLVAHAARTVLVHPGLGQTTEVDPLAGRRHALGQPGGLFPAQGAQVRRHQPSRDLVIGNRALGAGAGKIGEVLPGVNPSIAPRLDEPEHVHAR